MLTFPAGALNVACQSDSVLAHTVCGRVLPHSSASMPYLPSGTVKNPLVAVVHHAREVDVGVGVGAAVGVGVVSVGVGVGVRAGVRTDSADRDTGTGPDGQDRTVEETPNTSSASVPVPPWWTQPNRFRPLSAAAGDFATARSPNARAHRPGTIAAAAARRMSGDMRCIGRAS